MTVRILIVGTGGMANAHAEAFLQMEHVEVVGGVDTDPKRLHAFNAKHGIPNGFDSVEEAIGWGGFDAAANVTPDAVHCKTTLPLLHAGKHVLCEKPLATSVQDADAMSGAARDAGVVNMVNLTYRNVSALNAAARMVADGALGNIRHFEASYLQSWLIQPAWGDWKTESQWLWRLSTQHGSMGVLGDIGVHLVDFLCFATGQDIVGLSCRLTTFDKAPENRIGEYTLDANDSFAMHATLSGGASGVLHASRMATGHLNDLRLRIHGDEGALEVKFENNQSLLRACLGDDLQAARWQTITTPAVPTNYQRFVTAIKNGETVSPDFTLGARHVRILERAMQSNRRDSVDLEI